MILIIALTESLKTLSPPVPQKPYLEHFLSNGPPSHAAYSLQKQTRTAATSCRLQPSSWIELQVTHNYFVKHCFVSKPIIPQITCLYYK